MNKELLNKKSIYELRIIGRNLGVKSPTTLKKQELIYAIIERSLNLVEPHFGNRGRPPLPTPQNNQTNSQKHLSSMNIKMEKIEKVLENAKQEIINILFKN